ncbi:MAG: WbqC family protein [Nitrospiraceae bacterium]
MRVTIHQPHFLPWLGYLDKIDQADLFVALDTVQFKKNEWQNRNRIRSATGCQWMTVPVLHRFGQRMDEVRINSTVNWRQQHLRSLEIHYSRAPYSRQYIGALRGLYEQPWDRLIDLNVAVVQWLLDSFGIATPMRLASEWPVREEPTDRLVDICMASGATQYLCGAGAEHYIAKERFKPSGIELEIQKFHHPAYRQCYEPFEPGMSAIDLLFCCGPESLARLRDARVGQLQRVVV